MCKLCNTLGTNKSINPFQSTAYTRPKGTGRTLGQRAKTFLEANARPMTTISTRHVLRHSKGAWGILLVSFYLSTSSSPTYSLSVRLAVLLVYFCYTTTPRVPVCPSWSSHPSSQPHHAYETSPSTLFACQSSAAVDIDADAAASMGVIPDHSQQDREEAFTR